MKKYKCIKDYHPIIHKTDGTTGPTDEPVTKKGDTFIQMGKNDDRFKSTTISDLALYEYTLRKYSDCFILISDHEKL